MAAGRIVKVKNFSRPSSAHQGERNTWNILLNLEERALKAIEELLVKLLLEKSGALEFTGKALEFNIIPFDDALFRNRDTKG